MKFVKRLWTRWFPPRPDFRFIAQLGRDCLIPIIAVQLFMEYEGTNGNPLRQAIYEDDMRRARKICRYASLAVFVCACVCMWALRDSVPRGLDTPGVGKYLLSALVNCLVILGATLCAMTPPFWYGDTEEAVKFGALWGEARSLLAPLTDAEIFKYGSLPGGLSRIAMESLIRLKNKINALDQRNGLTPEEQAERQILRRKLERAYKVFEGLGLMAASSAPVRPNVNGVHLNGQFFQIPVIR